jgi:hypothetical protein
MMTAYIQSDPRSLLLEKRKQYEDAVAEALLDEDADERDERLRMVRAWQPMSAAVLHLPIYEPTKYEE